jgi:LL-diaminopimelate aminotransferase
MKIKLNDHFSSLKESYLFSETARRTRAYQAAHPDQKVIRLGIGDVTLPLAQCVVKAMEQATAEMGVKETFRGYPPEYGYDFLREKIAARYRRWGVRLTASEIFVSDGAKSDVGNIVDILGDNEIVLPDPVYPVYMDSNLMSGRTIRLLPSGEFNGFLPMPDTLAKKPYVLYLCSPNNPTGAVYNHAQLKAWVDFALETGSLIIFDAAYESFVEGDLPHTIYEIPGATACAVEICSFSKMAGFTGARCAWCVFPEALESGGVKLGKLWARRQATKFNGVNYAVQRGAEAVLTEEGERQCMEAVAYYKENARLIADLMRRKNIYFTGGVHSPYIWLKCPGEMDSWAFFDYLLDSVQVVGTPGAGFGASGEGYFRLTSFGDRAATQEAVARLDALL